MRDDDDTPIAIKTAAGERWTAWAKADESQDTDLDAKTKRSVARWLLIACPSDLKVGNAAGHGDIP